ncbi:lipocalin-like domain-containing protein [Solihabitans fulvus]|uniref:Lipocalin-like domain-containing protein n=1 Tax=Solihabitans fulvus TaxID=1892852 RepID=A0A5B2XGS4_9PSEU|nr:lipocalin-like domain-containing protein [Solihabitans fulvus]KAA2262593.1 lipocalin-like domain-containing protein [Solihabitans fulvus]
MAGTDLVGVWLLVSFHDVDDAGRTSAGPLGADPSGLLIYTADGHVSVSMMRTEPGPAPGFMGYAGRWRRDGDRVVHRIEVTPRADWVGTEQVRAAEFAGDRLTLHASTTVHGRRQRRVLVWRRAQPRRA